jgi:hypothetical protein
MFPLNLSKIINNKQQKWVKTVIPILKQDNSYEKAMDIRSMNDGTYIVL